MKDTLLQDEEGRELWGLGRGAQLCLAGSLSAHALRASSRERF